MDTQIPNDYKTPIISKSEEKQQEMLNKGEQKEENNFFNLVFKWALKYYYGHL